MCNPINSVNNSLIQAIQTDQDTYLIFFKMASTGMKIKAQPNQTCDFLCKWNMLLMKTLL